MIGILGGTFDPIHLGHLRMALELLEYTAIEEIRFIPCKNPVHKESAIANAEQRLQMLRLAVDQQPGFVIDEREIRRPSPSYMVETLEDLHHEFPKKQLGLILGSDTVMQFNTWKRWEDILALSTLIVIPRQAFTPEALPTELHGHIEIHGLATLPISSSHIRTESAAKRSIRYLVPDAVWQFINEQQLYR